MGGLLVTAARRGELPIAASCRPLIGYLVSQRQRHVSRQELAETVWAEHDCKGARHCLATALWRLKQACGEGPALFRLAGEDRIGFNWAAAHWVDVLALELRVVPLLRRAPQQLAEPELARLERALRLYRGDYLNGLDAEWVLLERQRLRSLYCDGLYQLINACAAHAQWQRAVLWSRQLGQEEPLREDVQRLQMLALAHTGNRALALALYRDCAARLQAELGVAPMAETQQLAHTLSVSTSLPAAADEHATVAPSAAIEHARRRIGRVRRALASTQRQLDSALRVLDPGNLPPR